MDLDVTIVTYREIFQYEAQKEGRYSEEYRKLSAAITLDKGDMAKLGVKEGQSVSVSNEVGRVVVKALASEDEPNPGIAFMVNSPWSNQLVRDDVCDTSIPGFKRITAKVSPSSEKITGVSELFKRMTA